MPPRYKYIRMTAADLSRHLDELDLSAGQFARLSGAAHKRVVQWLDGQEDIPHHVNVLLHLLLELPGAMEIAKRVADECVTDVG